MKNSIKKINYSQKQKSIDEDKILRIVRWKLAQSISKRLKFGSLPLYFLLLKKFCFSIKSGSK